jgi:hypothetical protein
MSDRLYVVLDGKVDIATTVFKPPVGIVTGGQRVGSGRCWRLRRLGNSHGSTAVDGGAQLPRSRGLIRLRPDIACKCTNLAMDWGKTARTFIHASVITACLTV